MIGDYEIKDGTEETVHLTLIETVQVTIYTKTTKNRGLEELLDYSISGTEY